MTYILWDSDIALCLWYFVNSAKKQWEIVSSGPDLALLCAGVSDLKTYVPKRYFKNVSSNAESIAVSFFHDR